MSDRPQRLSRKVFPVFRPIATRWMDNDVYGHVNNVHLLSYFDTAVNGWLIEQGLLDIQASGSSGSSSRRAAPISRASHSRTHSKPASA